MNFHVIFASLAMAVTTTEKNHQNASNQPLVSIAIAIPTRQYVYG
jgi:hypothetical protein